jgi:Xaa-Pro dipeptidase
MDLQAIQFALREAGYDGWLFFDFHNRDPISARILKIDPKRFTSRRWFYFIPANGEPQRLVHKIEPWKLDHLPGKKNIYLPWTQLHQLLKEILGNAKKVAMQYSPKNAIPSISVADAGTVDLVRSFGIDVVSSADLVSKFESHLTDKDLDSHIRAGALMQEIKDMTFVEIAKRIKAGEKPREVEIQHYMHKLMEERNLICEDGPIVAINEHAADPHFEPTEENSFEMKEGDLVLLDLWAKLKEPGSIYYDITWMGFIGTSIPDNINKYFQIIAKARDTAHEFIKDRFEKNEPTHGWEVDFFCRKEVIDAGYGEYFSHRTGHNIGEEVHGSGVNMDNLETKDERIIIPGTCFSIEPGLYMLEKKLGFRTEIDVYITEDGKAEVAGPIQQEVIAIMNL